MRKNKEDFYYEALSAKVMLDKLERFKATLADFVSFFKGGVFEGVEYSTVVVHDIYTRIDQRADYYLYFHSAPCDLMKMSQTKEVALMAYWILKYKPLSLPLFAAEKLWKVKNCTANEYFALYYILSYAKELSPRKDITDYISPKNIDTLVYSFMHRDISKEAMILYVDSLMNIAEK